MSDIIKKAVACALRSLIAPELTSKLDGEQFGNRKGNRETDCGKLATSNWCSIISNEKK